MRTFALIPGREISRVFTSFIFMSSVHGSRRVSFMCETGEQAGMNGVRRRSGLWGSSKNQGTELVNLRIPHRF